MGLDHFVLWQVKNYTISKIFVDTINDDMKSIKESQMPSPVVMFYGCAIKSRFSKNYNKLNFLNTLVFYVS